MKKLNHRIHLEKELLKAIKYDIFYFNEKDTAKKLYAALHKSNKATMKGLEKMKYTNALESMITNYPEFDYAMQQALKDFDNYHAEKIADQLKEIDGETQFVTVELSSAWTLSGNTELVQLELKEYSHDDETDYTVIRLEY